MTTINPLSVGILATFTFTSTISHLVPLLLQAPSHLVLYFCKHHPILFHYFCKSHPYNFYFFLLKLFLLYLFIVYFLRLVYLHLSTRSLFIRVFIRVSCIHVRCLLIIVTLVALFLWFPEQSAGLYYSMLLSAGTCSLLPLGRRVTVVVWSFIHSVTWNCVHFYATTKARTRSPREYIAI